MIISAGCIREFMGMFQTFSARQALHPLLLPLLQACASPRFVMQLVSNSSPSLTSTKWAMSSAASSYVICFEGAKCTGCRQGMGLLYSKSRANQTMVFYIPTPSRMPSLLSLLVLGITNNLHRCREGIINLIGCR